MRHECRTATRYIALRKVQAVLRKKVQGGTFCRTRGVPEVNRQSMRRGECTTFSAARPPLRLTSS